MAKIITIVSLKQIKNKQIIIGMIAVGLAAFLWSLDGVFLRPKFYTLPANVIVFLEHFLGLLLLSPIIFLNWKKILKIKKQIWLALSRHFCSSYFDNGMK